MKDFVKKMKWSRNWRGDYFATAESAQYMISYENGERILTRMTPYTGPESLPTLQVIHRVKTLKRAQELAERDRYLENCEIENARES